MTYHFINLLTDLVCLLTPSTGPPVMQRSGGIRYFDCAWIVRRCPVEAPDPERQSS
jgi:hypothetical protein